MAYSFNSDGESVQKARRYIFQPGSRHPSHSSSAPGTFGATYDTTGSIRHPRQVCTKPSSVENVIFIVVVGLLVSLLAFLLRLMIFEDANHGAVRLIESLSGFHFPTDPFNTLFSLY